jgi:hypothetical protein
MEERRWRNEDGGTKREGEQGRRRGKNEEGRTKRRNEE